MADRFDQTRPLGDFSPDAEPVERAPRLTSEDEVRAEARRALEERRAIREQRRRIEAGQVGLPTPEDAPPPAATPTPRPTEPGNTRTSNRAVAIGVLLFLGMAVVWVGSQFLDTGGNDDDPPPATSVAVPTTVLGSLASPIAMRGPSPVVCLDAGHGGADHGFVRPADGTLPELRESDYVLAQAWDLSLRLQTAGITVVMTRTSPNAVNASGLDVNGDGETIRDSERAGQLDELQARINICNAAHADLLVSLHLNGTDRNPNARGYEMWFTGCREWIGGESARFASLAYEAIARHFSAAGYGGAGREVNDDCVVSPLESEPGLLEHMVITGPDVPSERIRGSTMPATIVESLFLSNSADAAFLASAAGHEAIVAAYAEAIVAFLSGASATAAN